jgi:hypothetical protein
LGVRGIFGGFVGLGVCSLSARARGVGSCACAIGLPNDNITRINIVRVLLFIKLLVEFHFDFQF